jgi:hypothetical protein
MNHLLRRAVVAAGFTAFAVLPVCAATSAASSAASFASQSPSTYELSAAAGFSLPSLSSPLLRSSYGIAAPSFASSTLLSPNFSLDAGRNLDIAARFDNYDGGPSPLLSAVTAPYLGLANGGRYVGFTYAPSSELRLRLGSSFNSDGIDNLSVDPFSANGDLPLSYHASITQSLVAAASWDFSAATGFDVTAISSSRSGAPLGFDTNLPDRSSTNAIGVAAHVGLGGGWVTKLAYSEGLSQLDLRSGQASSEEQSYAIAIAKRGLFGDDAMGFAFSRPAPGLVSSFDALTNSGDLPPMVIAHGGEAALRPQAPENDFQLGYVTNFLDGALALQANASYQTNYQGQPGATAVSVLSRAKIRF